MIGPAKPKQHLRVTYGSKTRGKRDNWTDSTGKRAFTACNKRVMFKDTSPRPGLCLLECIECAVLATWLLDRGRTGGLTIRRARAAWAQLKGLKPEPGVVVIENEPTREEVDQLAELLGAAVRR